MSGGRRGRVRTWVRRVLLGVAAVVLVALVGKLVQLATLGPRTAGAATTAMEDSRPAGTAELDDLTVLLERDLGAPVTHSARGYRCTVGHRDRGWMVDHYYQECTWTGIDYVRMDDPDALDALVTAYALPGSGAAPDRCETLFLPLREDDARLRYLQVRTYPAGATGTACGPPVLLEETGPVAGMSRTVVTQPVTAKKLDPDAAWVVASHDVTFFTRDLGCGLGVIFCAEPMRDPAMPEVDRRGAGR